MYTGDSQVVGIPCVEAGYYGTDMGNAQVRRLLCSIRGTSAGVMAVLVEVVGLGAEVWDGGALVEIGGRGWIDNRVSQM